MFLSGGSYSKFRVKFFQNFEYDSGFLFNAGHFSGTSDKWGICFAVLKGTENGATPTPDTFNFDLVDMNSMFELEGQGTKGIYHTDNKVKASDWVREPVRGVKTYDYVQLSSATKVKQSGRGSMIQGGLGYMVSAGNGVYHNSTGVAMFTSAFSNGNGFSVTKDNFFRATALFAARRSIQRDWINWQDEYLAPNTEHPEYEQFAADSLVYALFNNKSQQSSLRNVKYKGKEYDITNEWFWLSSQEMVELANSCNFDSMYKDGKAQEDRFVYKLLQSLYPKLSSEAKEVIDSATSLLRSTMDMRVLMCNNDPSLQLEAFDAGYAQLKLVWKEYAPQEFKNFRNLYKKLEDKMIPLVHELGFLQK